MPYQERSLDDGFAYETIYQQLVTDGYTNSQAFNLYLNDLDAGQRSVLFGGVDRNKYTGELISLPVPTEDSIVTEWLVTLTSISYQDTSCFHSLTPSGFGVSALLDSGTSGTNIDTTTLN